MKDFKIEIIVALVVLLVMGVGVYSYRQYRDANKGADQAKPGMDRPIVSPQPSEPIGPNPSSMSVSATKTYTNGTFHIAGTVSLPTPCHNLDVSSRVMESYPEQVVIDMIVTDAGNPCVQVIDERAWSVDVKASENAVFSVRINAQPIKIQWLSV